ncbi:zinc-dependent metalloprotease [Fodinibius roseus]|nr:zinc-dependent metalloprotease [Fodinibius roseus]
MTNKILYVPVVLLLAMLMNVACQSSETVRKSQAPAVTHTATDTTDADSDTTGAETDSTETEEPSSYEEIVEEADRSAEGLLNLYYKDEKLYLEVPFDLLGRDMLLSSTISEISDNKLGTVGAKPHNPLQIQFARVDSVLLLQKIQKDAIAPDNNPGIHRALDRNSIGSVLRKFDIEAYNEEETSGIIEVTDFFVSDTEELSPFGPIGMTISSALIDQKQFKKNRSFIGGFKSFEDNLTIKSHLSYEYTLKEQAGSSTEEDTPFTAVMTRTLLLLPEDRMRPRIADPRIGVFTTRKNKYSGSGDKVEPVRYARRFRLEPRDVEAYNNGELSEPVEPITFYVDSDFPESWRATIKSAIRDWNETFERIGFEHAVRALDYPEEDPEFDPDNLKYNVVRYAPASVQNAMGPSWIDPRTGEILNASVYIYHDIVRLLNSWRFIQTAPADKAVRQTKLPESYRKEGIGYVVRHEIGHTLGFMHNMAASHAVPVDSLRSPSFTRKHGTTYSIMDYARYNYVAQPGDKERGVQLTPPKFGLYDYYLVDWNYRYFPEEVSKEDQKERLTRLVDEKAGDDRYRYGAQGAYLDPRSLSEDLGDDAVEASTYGIDNLKYVMNHINEWVEEEDTDYSYRQRIRNGMIMQYVRYLNHVYRNVGGIYLNKKYVGDSRPHYRSVPREKQREAFRMLLEELNRLDWLEQEEVVTNLPLTGSPSAVIRNQLIEVILGAPERVHLSALKSREENPYSPEDVMEDIFNSLWKEPLQEKSTLTEAEREFQKAYVQAVIAKSGLERAGATGTSAFASDDRDAHELRIKLPEFVEEHLRTEFGSDLYRKYIAPISSHVNAGRSDPVSASFGTARIRFHTKPVLDHLNYTYLKKVKSLLEEAVADDTAAAGAQSHYELLLRNIENVIR